MEFKVFASAVEAQFKKMTIDKLFIVNTNGDQLYDAYLAAFPAGTNELYIERTEHDCSTCRSFIKNIGNVVSIVPGQGMVSIWDITIDDETYQTVADAMSAYVKSYTVAEIFLHEESKAGNAVTVQQTEKGQINWHHFHCTIPNHLVSKDVATKRGENRTSKEVLQRGLEELTLDALNTVLDLIDQNSLYRGDEFKGSVKGFITLKKLYDKIETDSEKINFCWVGSTQPIARFRGSVIGTLIQDISEGMELDRAVASYESKVAPANYKRSSALITQGMIDKAMQTIDELGIEPSLHRRYASLDDITINNVLFADSSATLKMKDSIKSLLETSKKEKVLALDKVEEIGIDDFVTNVLPTITSMEVQVDNKHANNFVSLIAPEYSDAKNILKWDNNFSWAYTGGVTDSIKERVKEAGGNVLGALRISLAWINNDDLDLHVIEPSGEEIYFSHKRSRTNGQLDIDMTYGGTEAKPSVENIFWVNERDLAKGTYQVNVNQWSVNQSDNKGYIIQVEYNGQITEFNSKTSPKAGATDKVVTITYNGSEIELSNVGKAITSGSIAREVWNVTTNKFHKVNAMMMSPNFWDEQEVGNKHFFFMLDGCQNPDNIIGLYNEFLSNELNPHRKVFEVLGSKLKCPYVDNQLSGLGFSSTKRDELIVRVQGNFTRTLKIKF
jgi:hypothetical protein